MESQAGNKSSSAPGKPKPLSRIQNIVKTYTTKMLNFKILTFLNIKIAESQSGDKSSSAPGKSQPLSRCQNLVKTV